MLTTEEFIKTFIYTIVGAFAFIAIMMIGMKFLYLLALYLNF